MVHLVAFLGEMGTVCPLENGQGAGDSIDSWKMPSDLSLAPVLEQEPGSNQKEIWRSGVGWGGVGLMHFLYVVKFPQPVQKCPCIPSEKGK